MNEKEKYFIDLSKLGEEQQKHIFSLLPERKKTVQYWFDKHNILLYFDNVDGLWWVNGDIAPFDKTELTYPDFIKLFEGGEEENTEISFETEYRLEEFRKIQSEYFDENGECYSDIRLSKNIMEQMLTLINQLETELNSNQ